jgi:hypothetical protein
VSRVALVVGSDGKLADFRILGSNQNTAALNEVGKKLRLALESQPLRLPNGRPVEFTYELTSEVLLPSGRAPGVAVDVLGLPVKQGRHKKSQSISILKPRIGVVTPSVADIDRNGQVQKLPPALDVGVTILGLGFDPVDLGAQARQVVHARLLQQRVL